MPSSEAQPWLSPDTPRRGSSCNIGPTSKWEQSCVPSRVSERQYRHFAKVDVSNIRACFSDDCVYRWTLDIPYRAQSARTHTVSVILKNPSSANECVADKTIQNVERQIHWRFPTAATLKVLNLFAIRATYTRCVKAKIALCGDEYVIGDKNDCTIQRTLAGTDHVVLAWGARSEIPNDAYGRRITQVIRTLDECRCNLWHIGRLSKDKHPLHGMRWRCEDEKLEFPMEWRWWPQPP